MFGVGGGTMIVPAMLLFGIPLKNAIGISAMQMSVSAIFGSFFNQRAFGLDLRGLWRLALAGVLGGVLGAKMLDIFSERLIGYLFIAFVIFGLVKIYLKKEPGVGGSGGGSSAGSESFGGAGAGAGSSGGGADLGSRSSIRSNTGADLSGKRGLILFALVFVIAAAGSVIGIGGGILIVPLLSAYFGYSVKEATVVSLFFIAFTATASFFTLIFLGYVFFDYALLVAAFSIVGVRGGVALKKRLSHAVHRRILLGFYAVLLAIFIYKMRTNGYH